RSGHAPFGHTALVVGDDVFAPEHAASGEVETIQNPRRAERQDFVARDARRGSRSFTGDGRVVTSGVGVRPAHAAGHEFVADHRFLFAALFQGYGAVAG